MFNLKFLYIGLLPVVIYLIFCSILGFLVGVKKEAFLTFYILNLLFAGFFIVSNEIAEFIIEKVSHE